MNFGGKDKFNRLTEFLNYIDFFDTKAIVLADGHENIIEKLKDLQRGRLTFYEIIREKGYEFEDQFDSTTIINSMSKIAQDKCFKFGMTVGELDAARTSENVADVMETYLKANGGELDKTVLARELAHNLARQIESNGQRQKTKFEEEIVKINNIVSKGI